MAQSEYFSDSLSVLRKCHTGPNSESDRPWATAIGEICSSIRAHWAHVRAHVNIDGNEEADKLANKSRVGNTNFSAIPMLNTWESFHNKIRRKFDERQKRQLDDLVPRSYSVAYYRTATQGYKDNDFLTIPNGLEIPCYSKLLLNLRTGNSVLLEQYRRKYKVGEVVGNRSTCLLCEDDKATPEHLFECPVFHGLSIDESILRNPLQAQKAFAPRIAIKLKDSNLLPRRHGDPTKRKTTITGEVMFNLATENANSYRHYGLPEGSKEGHTNIRDKEAIDQLCPNLTYIW